MKNGLQTAYKFLFCLKSKNKYFQGSQSILRMEVNFMPCFSSVASSSYMEIRRLTYTPLSDRNLPISSDRRFSTCERLKSKKITSCQNVSEIFTIK